MTQTVFIKPSREPGSAPELCLDRVRLNLSRGVVTNLFLDTNVLVRIETVVKEGNTWVSVKRNGLHKLIRFLQRSKGAVAISPGLGFTEMPPKSAGFSVYCFNTLCSLHLPLHLDDPTGTRPKYGGIDYEYGILDLSIDAQYAHSLPYVSLLYLNLAHLGRHTKNPLDRYRQYLEYVEKQVGVVGAKESEIARHCFAPAASQTPLLNTLCSKVRDNFLKTKIKIGKKSKERTARSVKDMHAIAFNGACDLFLLNAANAIDTTGIDGMECDSWIATNDSKLAAFSGVFHNFTVDGDASKGAELVDHPESENHEYWGQSKALFQQATRARQNRKLNFQSLSEEDRLEHMIHCIQHTHNFVRDRAKFE